MARQYFINGETLVSYNGQQLGLSTDPIRVTVEAKTLNIIVDTWGPTTPPEIQQMLAEARIVMSLIHFDRAVLDQVYTNMMASPAIGQVARAGSLLSPFMAPLSLSSPIGQKPWTFPKAYAENSGEFQLGVERTVLAISFRALPIPLGNPSANPFGTGSIGDPYGGGTGSLGTVLWTYS